MKQLKLENDATKEEYSILKEVNLKLKDTISENDVELKSRLTSIMNIQNAMRELTEENERIMEENNYFSELLASGETDIQKKVVEDMKKTIQNVILFHVYYL